MDASYIVIEGPIGVGKTTLGQLMGKALSARLVLEKSEDNPFLREFYTDPKRYAFQTQIFFLLSRYRQHLEFSQLDLFERVTITDYFLPKDKIFAELVLSEEELSLYNQIYPLLNLRVPTPDLVIYLQADTDALLDRIKERGRDYEKPIGWDYLDRVNQAYNHFFFRYTDSPLLVIETTAIDFAKDREAFEDFLKQVKHMKKGIQYYVPKR